MSNIMHQLIIRDYPDKILISKSRRPVYYVKKGSSLRGKDILPKRYKNKAKYNYDSKGVLVEIATGAPILSNSKTAGKERYWVVNFQGIWNGAVSGAGRASKINKLKDILRPYILTIPVVLQYPAGLEIHLYNTTFEVDASNKGSIYTKVIEDLMVSEGILKDDSPEFINDTGRIVLHKVKKQEEIRMEINILKSYF